LRLAARLKDHDSGLHGAARGVGIEVLVDLPGRRRSCWARCGVRACATQAGRLLAWAKAWPQRAWAAEGAGGLGHLLAQQLVAAGEPVLDVPAKLGARVRLLDWDRGRERLTYSDWLILKADADRRPAAR
jgi:hypothetical protein